MLQNSKSGDVVIQGKIFEVKGTKGRIANKNLNRGGNDVVDEVKNCIKKYVNTYLASYSKEFIKKEDFEAMYNDIFGGKNYNFDNKRTDTLTQAIIRFTSWVVGQDVNNKLNKNQIYQKIMVLFTNVFCAHIMQVSNRNKILREYGNALKQFSYPTLDIMIQNGDIYSEENANNLIRALVAIDARAYKSVAGFDYLLMINDESRKGFMFKSRRR